MEVFLKEMVSLAGQGDNNPETVPVLELQFGDIRTRTTISLKAEAPAMSITALLPRDERLVYSESSLSDATLGEQQMMDTACLWHADEGRYAMARNVPLRQLQQEWDVFDAILDTADQAEQWYGFLCARLARPH